MKKIYIINPFVKIFNLNSHYSLYNPFTQDICVLSSKEYKNYKLGIIKKQVDFNQTDKELYSLGILIDQNTDFIKSFFKWITKKDKYTDEINVLYLLLCGECNLRCKYCFVKDQFDGAKLTKFQINKALKLFKNQKTTQQRTVILYGGEPLLDKALLKYTLNKIRNILGNNVSISIVTNGLLLDDEYLSIFKKYKINIGFSLDGLTSNSNRNRVNLLGNCENKNLKSKYRYLLQNYPFSISCTLTDNNLPELIDFVKKLDKKTKGFSYNLLIKKNIKYPKNIAKYLIKIEKILLNKGIMEDRIYYRRILKLINKQIHIKDCAGYGQQMVITPNGRIGVCHGIDWSNKLYFPLDINTTPINLKLNKEYIWKLWNKRSPFNHPNCLNCVALTLCGGGCAASKIKTGYNIYNLDQNHCKIYKAIITEIIKETSKNAIINHHETR